MSLVLHLHSANATESPGAFNWCLMFHAEHGHLFSLGANFVGAESSGVEGCDLLTLWGITNRPEQKHRVTCVRSGHSCVSSSTARDRVFGLLGGTLFLPRLC
ncbi:unnamed protein product [Merluccius merluccius]